MIVHHASSAFWASYDALPERLRKSADRNFALLKSNPQHPSLHFKRVGHYWPARVGIGYRAVSVPVEDGLLALSIRRA